MALSGLGLGERAWFVGATPKGLLTQMEFQHATYEWLENTGSATLKWGLLGDWDVSAVKDFSYVFAKNRAKNKNAKSNGEMRLCCFNGGTEKASAFTGDGLEKWITTSVTSLASTFYISGWSGSSMEANLGNWDVSKVTDLTGTFWGSSRFTGKGIDRWDTSSVTTLSGTFSSATAMNADLSRWNVAKVTTMTNAFDSTTSLSSCNKRLIADAWKSSSVFVATAYDTDWAADTCAVRFKRLETCNEQ